MTATDIERAKYDLGSLPLRQATLRHMIREPWQSVEGIKILRAEFDANARRIEAAKAAIASAQVQS